MYFLSAFIFGISSNLDNFVVGLSYGMKKKPIGWVSNLLIAFISLSGTVLSMMLGSSLLLVLPENFAKTLGSSIFILIGIAGIWCSFQHKSNDDTTQMSLYTLSLHESLLLGVALTMNNIGLGIGAGMTGLLMIPAALCSFFFSLLFLYTGNFIGCAQHGDRIGKFTEPAAGILMIVLGIYEFFI